MKPHHDLTIFLTLLALFLGLTMLIYMAYQMTLLKEVMAADFKIDIVRDEKITNELLSKTYGRTIGSGVISERDDIYDNARNIIGVKEYVLGEAKKAGLDPVRIERLIACESSWDNMAISKSGRYVGLFQIGSIHGMTVAQRQDYKVSTAWAIRQIKANGYKAWPHCGFIK